VIEFLQKKCDKVDQLTSEVTHLTGVVEQLTAQLCEYQEEEEEEEEDGVPDEPGEYSLAEELGRNERSRSRPPPDTECAQHAAGSSGDASTAGAGKTTTPGAAKSDPAATGRDATKQQPQVIAPPPGLTERGRGTESKDCNNSEDVVVTGETKTTYKIIE
jgi:hypothetical protein